MPCATGMAWSPMRRDRARALKALRSPKACIPTICGRPISKANSSSATSATVIRSPSPTTPRVPSFRTPLLRKGFAARDSFRQRRALRFSARTVSALQAFGVVAPAGDLDRAHPARPSAAERPSRTHASDAEEGGHASRRRQLPSAAGQVRRVRGGVQRRASTRGARHAVSGRTLHRVAAALHRHSGTELSVPRSHCDRHQLRPDVSSSQEDQLKRHLSRSGSGDQRSRPRYLAGQFYGLRSRLYRPGGENFAAPGKPLRPKSVTYVLGTICYPCVRSGQSLNGAAGGIRTHDIQNHNLALLPTELQPPCISSLTY